MQYNKNKAMFKMTISINPCLLGDLDKDQS